MTGGFAMRGAALVLWCLASPPVVRAEDAPAANGALNPLHGLAEDSLSGFRDRPLFAPSRAEPRVPDAAPAPVVAPVPEPPPEPPPAIRLVGIVSGAQTLAIVRPADGGKTSLLATGDMLGGWTATVSAEGLTLGDGARRVAFALFRHGAAAGTGHEAPVAAPPAAKGADAFPPTGDPPPP